MLQPGSCLQVTTLSTLMILFQVCCVDVLMKAVKNWCLITQQVYMNSVALLYSLRCFIIRNALFKVGRVVFGREVVCVGLAPLEQRSLNFLCAVGSSGTEVVEFSVCGGLLWNRGC